MESVSSHLPFYPSGSILSRPGLKFFIEWQLSANYLQKLATVILHHTSNSVKTKQRKSCSVGAS